jgi:hypothetical protein
MAKKGPASYNVTITAVRNYEPGKGPPRKNQFWQFSQAVQSSSGYPGALATMVGKFFDFYPNHAIVLPTSEKGQKILTRNDKAGLKGYLEGKQSGPKGDYELDSADATLRIHKMRAMSGETPVSLTPKSQKEYDDKLHHNNESIQWWNDPIVQMPAPIYVLDKAAGPAKNAPGMITYKGRTYRRATATAVEDLPVEDVQVLFFQTMEDVAEKMTEINTAMIAAGKKLLDGEAGTEEVLTETAKRTYHEVIPAILNARDLAAVLQSKKGK